MSKELVHVPAAGLRGVAAGLTLTVPTRALAPQLGLFEGERVEQPFVVAYGMGVDSTAMLVGLEALGERPDLILFADTGGEKPETMAYLPVIQAWLRRVGFPPVVVVKRAPTDGKNGRYETLEGNCLVNQTLPSLAFGFKSCSLKWKREPQDAYVRTWAPARRAWAAGLKVRKAIGYDAGKKDSKRAWKLTDDARYTYWYPLREWGWDRERCVAEIAQAGLPVPPKSACFFCPASQPEEIATLQREHPELVGRIMEMERTAKRHLTVIQGLWGRDSKRRPGSMTMFLEAGGVWPPQALETTDG